MSSQEAVGASYLSGPGLRSQILRKHMLYSEGMNAGWRLGLWIQLTSMPGRGQQHGSQEDPSK